MQVLRKSLNLGLFLRACNDVKLSFKGAFIQGMKLENEKEAK